MAKPGGIATFQEQNWKDEAFCGNRESQRNDRGKEGKRSIQLPVRTLGFPFCCLREMGWAVAVVPSPKPENHNK